MPAARASVKLPGPYRLSAGAMPHADVAAFAHELIQAAPERVVGSAGATSDGCSAVSAAGSAAAAPREAAAAVPSRGEGVPGLSKRGGVLVPADGGKSCTLPVHDVPRM
mgnify:CR=1 FL=1